MSVKIFPLSKERHYLIQMIRKVDGVKSKAFVCTIVELFEKLDSMEDAKDDERYVDILMDMDAVIEHGDDSDGMSDFILTVPLFSVHALRTLLAMIDEGEQDAVQ